MSRIFTFYIMRQVLQGVMLVLLALAGIGILFNFISQLEHLQNDYVSYQDIFAVVLYSIPASVYEKFPPAVLIGSLLALGNMASRSELIAMRAATVSKVQITGMVALTGIFLMLFIAAVGELLLPSAEQKKEQLEDKIKGYNVSGQLINVWIKEAGQLVKIGRVINEHELSNVYVYELKDKEVVASYKAGQAFLENGKWSLISVKKTVFSQNQVTTSVLNQLQFDWSLNLSLLKVLDDKSGTLSLKSLYEYIQYMKKNELDSSRYRLSFWLKLLSPLTVMVMLMLALPFVFGSLRNMAAGNFIVVGLVIGLIYYIASGIASNLGHVYGFPPFINAFAPSVIFIFLALLLMLRQRF